MSNTITVDLELVLQTMLKAGADVDFDDDGRVWATYNWTDEMFVALDRLYEIDKKLDTIAQIWHRAGMLSKDGKRGAKNATGRIRNT